MSQSTWTHVRALRQHRKTGWSEGGVRHTDRAGVVPVSRVALAGICSFVFCTGLGRVKQELPGCISVQSSLRRRGEEEKKNSSNHQNSSLPFVYYSPPHVCVLLFVVASQLQLQLHLHPDLSKLPLVLFSSCCSIVRLGYCKLKRFKKCVCPCVSGKMQ
jgi:hypothetical protein